jgi:hypothetical protein
MAVKSSWTDKARNDSEVKPVPTGNLDPGDGPPRLGHYNATGVAKENRGGVKSIKDYEEQARRWIAHPEDFSDWALLNTLVLIQIAQRDMDGGLDKDSATVTMKSREQFLKLAVDAMKTLQAMKEKK